MKKLVLLSLTVLFLLFLAACGNTDDEAKDTAENDTQKKQKKSLKLVRFLIKMHLT